MSTEMNNDRVCRSRRNHLF